MADDNGDEIMIGPMPAVEDHSAMTLTTIEPEDDTDETTILADSETIGQRNNNKTNGFDNNTEYDYQDNTSLVDPPLPQPLFFLSEMGKSLDGLTYDPHILQVAETNEVDVPWADLKPIIRNTILKQCDTMETAVSDTEVLSTITGIKTNILHCIDHHSGTPFTIQRLCELISAPTRHYTLFIKYLHAIEKVLSVASTWDSFCEETHTPAPSDPASSQQQLENDVYTGYEMPDVVLTSSFDGNIDVDEDEDDENEDDDDDDDDDENEDEDHHDNKLDNVVNEIETEEVDDMETDNASPDHQDSQTNGSPSTTNNSNSTEAMDDDSGIAEDSEHGHQVPSSSQ
ncbi:hypothetical protein BCR42DRAFT_450609 [Absidia repens]|uniref:PPP4R2-domain-containing protein n=1 Tax=Absidia repens TaxID=90262 RepID=A0A1X2IM67_9FUNG|nr:hypothetical protein BCR42DRAFT_450609 [Absidia repens]